MGFEDLLSALIRELRFRVRNGQLTERGLARLAGVSQPHMHHILSGKRGLTPAVADRMLEVLSLDLASLMRLARAGEPPESWNKDDAPQAPDSPGSSPGPSDSLFEVQDPPVLVPILDGLLGLGYLRPHPFRQPRYLPVPRRELPPDCPLVAARLAADPRLEPFFAANDLVVIAVDPLPPSFGQTVAETAWVIEDETGWRLELPSQRGGGGPLAPTGDDRETEAEGKAGATVPMVRERTEDSRGAEIARTLEPLEFDWKGVDDSSSSVPAPRTNSRVGIVVLCIRRMGPLRLPLFDGIPTSG